MASWWDQLKNSFDWSGVGQATPEYIGRENIRDPLIGAGISMATLPERALGASANALSTGVYNPAPAVETALNTMGVGGVAGVPMAPGETAFGAGIIRPKQPPLIGGYHGTGSPTDFSSFQLPPPTHDLGIHTTIDPNVAAQYARNKPSFGLSLSHLQPEDLSMQAHARTVPVLVDTQNTLKVPFDAGKWNQADNVIQPLEEAVAKGGRYQLPRGILEDMRNIAGSDKTWQDQFAPMLKDKGYDSLFYPHVTDYGTSRTGKYNTFMTFDPKQTIPRFSPEGMQAAAERGVQNPMPKDLAYDEGGPKNWSLPRGILKKITDPEPAGPVWDRVAERQQQWQTEYDKQFASPMQDFTDLKKKFENKEISGEQFWKEYDKIFNNPPSPPPPSALQPIPKGMLAQLDADLAAGKISKEEFDRGFKFVSANTPESGMVPENYKKIAAKSVKKYIK